MYARRSETSSSRPRTAAAARPAVADPLTELSRLQSLVGNAAVTRWIVAQRDCIKGHKGPADPTYKANASSAHYYEQEFDTCFKADNPSCNTLRVLLAARKHPAPGATGTPVKTGDKTKVPVLGSVTHEVDESRKTIRNRTDPGHLLDKGEVEIQVVDKPDRISMRYTGYGTGSLGRLNTLLSGQLWGSQHQKIKDDVAQEKPPT